MSPQYLALKEVSKQCKARTFRDLLAMQHVPIREITRVHLLDLRNAINKARGPGAAGDFASHVAALFNWAEEEGRIPASPARRMMKGLQQGEILAWKDRDYQMAITSNELPERIRRALVLARWTAQRRGDLVKMQWQDLYTDDRGEQWIHVTQQKTAVQLEVPVSAELSAELKVWRAAHHVFDRFGNPQGTILAEIGGEPWSAVNLSVQIHTYLARLPRLTRGLSIHGLRKFALTWAAQHGATTHELQAYGGHKTAAMVQHYTKSAEQMIGANAIRSKVFG
jgi:integrase